MSTELSSSFPNRLKLLIDQRFGGSQAGFSRAANLPAGSVSAYLAGESLPGFEKILNICAATGVTTDWLILGIEPMMRGATPAQTSAYSAIKGAELVWAESPGRAWMHIFLENGQEMMLPIHGKTLVQLREEIETLYKLHPDLAKWLPLQPN